MVAFQWKSLHVNNNNFTTYSRNVSKLHHQGKFFSVLSWSNKAPFCYVRWIVSKCVPTNIVLIRFFRVWKDIFGIRDLTKLRCGNRESDKYIDGIRDLTFPREARLIKKCAQDAGFCQSGMPETVTTHWFLRSKQINQASAKWCLLSNQTPYGVSG